MAKMNFYIQTKKRNGKRWITKAYFKTRKDARDYAKSIPFEYNYRIRML